MDISIQSWKDTDKVGQFLKSFQLCWKKTKKLESNFRSWLATIEVGKINKFSVTLSNIEIRIRAFQLLTLYVANFPIICKSLFEYECKRLLFEDHTSSKSEIIPS